MFVHGRLLWAVALELHPGLPPLPLWQPCIRDILQLAPILQARRLDVGLLDPVTWPEFLWDWLRIMNDPNLACMYDILHNQPPSRAALPSSLADSHRLPSPSPGSDDTDGPGPQAQDRAGARCTPTI